MRNRVYVRDYTVPGDWDSAGGIRQAIHAAKEQKAEELVFEAGTYMLKSWITPDYMPDDRTTFSQQDVGRVFHIYLKQLHGLRVIGAVDGQGNPATVLVGYNDQKVHSFLPAIIKAEECDSLILENIAFDRYPQFASAGKVLDVAGDEVTVEVAEGNPCHDGMGTYCINRFSPDGTTLTGESVTYGDGSGQNWTLAGERTLVLKNADVASKVSKGERLSWHQGAKTDYQVNLSRCDDLALNNVRTYNSNGFAMRAHRCKNIMANKVVFKPAEGNQLFTAPRDAWKLLKCSGNIEITGMVVDGVRMDGQNMHSHWLELHEILSSNEVVFNGRGFPQEDIPDHSEIEFYSGDKMVTGMVKETRMLQGEDGKVRCRVMFTEPLPDWAEEGMLCAAKAWEPDRYLCRDSHFLNIAGAGHLVRFDNLVLLNCKYENLMNPGILLGAELPYHMEGGHATNILIKWCEFINCGFHPRYEAVGCIGIRSAGLHGPYNKDIIISDNLFRNSQVGIHVTDAQNVYMIRNRFEGVEEPVRVEEETTHHIFVYE